MGKTCICYPILILATSVLYFLNNIPSVSVCMSVCVHVRVCRLPSADSFSIVIVVNNDATNIQVKYHSEIWFHKGQYWVLFKNSYCNIIQVSTSFLLGTAGNSVTITQDSLCTSFPNKNTAQHCVFLIYQSCQGCVSDFLTPASHLASPQLMAHASLWTRNWFMLSQ